MLALIPFERMWTVARRLARYLDRVHVARGPRQLEKLLRTGSRIAPLPLQHEEALRRGALPDGAECLGRRGPKDPRALLLGLGRWCWCGLLLRRPLPLLILADAANLDNFHGAIRKRPFATRRRCAGAHGCGWRVLCMLGR